MANKNFSTLLNQLSKYRLSVISQSMTVRIPTFVIFTVTKIALDYGFKIFIDDVDMTSDEYIITFSTLN